MKFLKSMKKMTGICLLATGIGISVSQSGIAAQTVTPTTTMQTTEVTAPTASTQATETTVPQTKNEILLQDNVWFTAKPSVEDTYFKIQVPEAGYIRIDHENEADRMAIFKICNKDKQELSSDYFVNDYRYHPVKAGVYYIKTKGAYGIDYKLKYTYIKKLTLKEHNDIHVYPGTYYFTYKPNRNEKIIFEDYSGGGEIILCNEKKEKMEEEYYISWGETSCYLEKGKIYNICYTVSDKDIQLDYKTEKYKPNENTTKKKAILLKKNCAKDIVFVSGKPMKYWYKIVLNKKQRIRVGYNTHFKPVLYKANGKTKVKVNHSWDQRRLIMGYTTSTKKLAKGTYYVRFSYNGRDGYETGVEWLSEYK